MQCQNGHPISDGNRFCVACGAPAALPTGNQSFSSLNAPAPVSMATPTTGYAVAAAATTSGFAIASLVLGIIGGSILAIIFGFVALSQIKKSGAKGRGMAIAGVVLGFVWTALWILFVVVGIANSASSSRSWDDGYKYGYHHALSTSQCDWWLHGPSGDNRYDWEAGCRAGYYDNP